MELTTTFKSTVRDEVLRRRELHSGSDKQFSITIGINPSIFSRLKKGETESIISDHLWLTLGRQFGVTVTDDNWKVAKTYIYEEIEDIIKNCKRYSQSKMLIDSCGIGKTQTLKAVAANLPNIYYIDCSQNKSKIQFVRSLARAVGVDNRGKVNEVLENTKYYLNLIGSPVIALDEAGDLEYSTFLTIKEIWNSTEGNVGWFLTGADGLAAKINKGIGNRKVGYAEIFSRFAGNMLRITPESKEQKDKFWKDLFTEVAQPNVTDQADIPELVKKCMAMSSGYRHDLRFMRDLIIENRVNHG